MKIPPQETFGCDRCGCPSVTLPDPLINSGRVCCQRCGSEIGTWQEYREQVAQAVSGGASDGAHPYTSADPARS